MNNYANKPFDNAAAEVPCCGEVPLKIALDGINKQLAEADKNLVVVLCNIVGAPRVDELEEKTPDGMQEQIQQIDCLAARVLSESRRMSELLFGEAR